MENPKPDATANLSANTETGTPVGLDSGAVAEEEDSSGRTGSDGETPA